MFCEGALAKLISGASSPKFGDLGFYGFYWFCQCFLLLGKESIGKTNVFASVPSQNIGKTNVFALVPSQNIGFTNVFARVPSQNIGFTNAFLPEEQKTLAKPIKTIKTKISKLWAGDSN